VRRPWGLLRILSVLAVAALVGVAVLASCRVVTMTQFRWLAIALTVLYFVVSALAAGRGGSRS